MMIFPLPLDGGGLGRGWRGWLKPMFLADASAPSPQRLRPPRYALPARGEGAKPRFYVSPTRINRAKAITRNQQKINLLECTPPAVVIFP